MDNGTGKKVLILGNGFDLAHELPTKYTDFMYYCNRILDHFPEGNINPVSVDFVITALKEKLNISPKIIEEIVYLLIDNIWYNYLNDILKGKKIKGENWIDFESEISSVIQRIDRETENLLYEFEIPLYPSEDILFQNDKLMRFLNKYVNIKRLEPENSKEHIVKLKMKELRKELNKDLESLIKALELYLSFVEGQKVKVKSKDIEDNYDYIINFNYTHTYQKFYGKYKEIFHIHGEVHEKPDVEINNMVLGIDEYWSEKERDSHTNFTIFKKFAQRIQKRTGVENYKWFDEIKSNYEKNNEVSEVFIFGHSLDITDKDILYDYLESEATSVTIYCMDKETEGEYIANVIKVIGEKRLLEKVNQVPPKLRFVLQSDMVKRTDIHESDIRDLAKV